MPRGLTPNIIKSFKHLYLMLLGSQYSFSSSSIFSKSFQVLPSEICHLYGKWKWILIHLSTKVRGKKRDALFLPSVRMTPAYQAHAPSWWKYQMHSYGKGSAMESLQAVVLKFSAWSSNTQFLNSGQSSVSACSRFSLSIKIVNKLSCKGLSCALNFKDKNLQ